MTETVDAPVVSARPTLTIKPVKHLHFATYAEWKAEAERRSLTVTPSVFDVPFRFDIALSSTGSGRMVGACFLEGIDFGWLREDC